MDPPGGPPVDVGTLVAQDAKLRRGVLAYAYQVTHDIQKAKEASQEAFARVLEGKGWYGWQPGGKKTLFSHFCSVVDTVVANARARAATARETGEVPAYDETTEDPAPGIEERIDQAEEHQEGMRLAALVMARLDERCLRMLELEQQGIHDAAKQAEILECTVGDIRLARERVAYHRDKVLAEEAKKRGPK
jgi:DNA-directed RNA polymerase specialized sigma24 family protein